MAPQFVNIIFFFLISLHLPSLLASIVALPFAMFATSSLDSVFLLICYVLWKVVSCLKLELQFLVVGFHSPSLRLFLFFSRFPWYRCAELIFRRFGPFNSEFEVLCWYGHLVCVCLVCEVLLTSQLVVVHLVLQACVFLLRGDFGFSVIIPLIHFLAFCDGD